MTYPDTMLDPASHAVMMARSIDSLVDQGLRHRPTSLVVSSVVRVK